MKKIQAALIGAGDRGFNCYAPFAVANPWRMEFTAVAEANDEKRQQFGDQFNIPEERRFRDYRDLLNQPRLADALIISTSDKLHYEPAMMAMKQGYHIMLEKPMSTDLSECLELAKAAEGYNKTFILCYVLRYTAFFSTIHQMIKAGRIGKINSIVHFENIPLIDQVHGFTRGIFRNTDIAAPIILSHCCHDLDVISWFAGAKCRSVASFGSLTHFCSDNAPDGAPDYCLDGCPHSQTCAYYAPNIYLTEDIGWPTSTISTDMSFDARLAALKTGPYGRCVYKCDNNVVDNQTVIIEFENAVTATFVLQPFASSNGRTIKITGDKGEIRANMDVNVIEIFDILTGRKETIQLKPSKYKYGGGDYGIMDYFINMAANNAQGGLTSMESSLESHLIAFMAEESRKNGIVVQAREMIRQTEARAI